MEQKIIKIKCKGSSIAKLEDLIEYQGNLKDLTETNYDRLLISLKKGFTQPISVWIKPDKTKYILDGHQRVRVLSKIKSEGWIIPDLPICEIYAETEQEAADIVLRNISQYGTVTMDGLIEFSDKLELDIKEIAHDFNFPELKLEKFNFDNNEKRKDLSDDYKESYEVVIECKTEQEQKSIFLRLSEEGLKCRLLTL